MQEVLDAISRLLKQPWNHEGDSILYMDGVVRWEISYIRSHEFIWILGKSPEGTGHPIIDVQLRRATVRESEILSIGNDTVTVMGKVVVLYSPEFENRRSETWIYLWNDGRLEVNVCIAG